MKRISNHHITKINAKYHNMIAPAYDTYQEQNQPKVIAFYQDLFDKIFNYFKKNGRKTLKILDLGCGTGYLEQFLKIDTNDIVGIDVSENLLKIARKKHPKARYLLQDLYTFPGDFQFDLIVENATLHHLKNYKFSLEKSTQLLKQGGVLFLGAEPNYFCYHYLSFVKNFFRTFLPDRRMLKTKEIKEKLEKLAEYHMYFSDGFNPYQIKNSLLSDHFAEVDLRFSSRELIASLIDRMNLNIVDFIPNKLMDLTGIFSRSFYLTAYNKK